MNKSISADFPFESRFIEVNGSNMHYIDAGKGDPLLFIHGQPTSSYLWRNIIPHLQNDYRCIAPDLIGMGKSDKPKLDYNYHDHYDFLEKFIDKLYSTGVQELKIVESFEIHTDEDFEVEESENTISILNRYIDEAEMECDKSIVKGILQKIYSQACEVE